MKTPTSPAEQQAHLIKLLRGLDTAMLITLNTEHQFHGRPMAIAQVEDDGTLWFLTAADTAKVHEIEFDSHVHLTAQKGDSVFVTLSGLATLVEDSAKVNELWREPHRVWFPGGPNDPSIELIKVRPERGEFWDNSGGNRFKFLWEAAKAYATGTTPPPDDESEHGRVRL